MDGLKNIFIICTFIYSGYGLMAQDREHDLPPCIDLELGGAELNVDGIFTELEWREAAVYQVKDNYSLLFMADSDYLYVGLKFPTSNGECVCELHITSDKESV